MVEGAYERLIADPQQLKAEVVVAHRVGWMSPDHIEDATPDEIVEADAILARYVAHAVREAVKQALQDAADDLHRLALNPYVKASAVGKFLRARAEQSGTDPGTASG